MEECNHINLHQQPGNYNMPISNKDWMKPHHHCRHHPRLKRRELELRDAIKNVKKSQLGQT
jgi:hypothetical protein